MKSSNIPEVKLGIIAVSRDCFPIALSEKRRAAISAACAAKGTDLYECKTTVENEHDMQKSRGRSHRRRLQRADRIPRQLRPRNTRNADCQAL